MAKHNTREDAAILMIYKLTLSLYIAFWYMEAILCEV